MWLGEWVPPELSHHPVKFGGYSNCGKTDTRFWIWKMNTWSKDYMTWWVGSHCPKLPLCHVWWPEVLWKCRYVFHLPCDHVIKRSCGTWGPSTLNYHLVNFGGHRCCRSLDIRFFICHHIMWSKGHMTKQAWQKEKACARSPRTLFYIKVRSFETLKIGEKIDFSIQIHIQNSVKHLRWSIFRK